MKTRVERVLTDEYVAKIGYTDHSLHGDGEVSDAYEDGARFGYNAKLEAIEKSGLVLKSGLYADAADIEDDGSLSG